MNEIKTMKRNVFLPKIKNALLWSFAGTLLDNGYDIIHAKGYDYLSGRRGCLYFTFHKGGKFGYVQKENFGGFSFATVRRGSKEHGTGTRIIDGAESLRLDQCTDVLTAVHPRGIKLYRSLEDFFTDPNHKRNYVLIKTKK